MINKLNNSQGLNESRPRPYRQHPDKRGGSFTRDMSNLGVRRPYFNDYDPEHLKKLDYTSFGDGRPGFDTILDKYRSIAEGKTDILKSTLCDIIDDSISSLYYESNANDVYFGDIGNGTSVEYGNIGISLSIPVNNNFHEQNRAYLQNLVSDVVCETTYDINDDSEENTIPAFMSKSGDKIKALAKDVYSLSLIIDCRNVKVAGAGNSVEITIPIDFSYLDKELKNLAQNPEFKQYAKDFYYGFKNYVETLIKPLLITAVKKLLKLEYDRVFNESTLLNAAAQYLVE